ncbi:MAG: FtsX-like permease family protein [Gemmatimonadetes bacterium]|nr:FtsX-like permease family protein [Gemmatimonadota bacterium]MYF74656.1 FtsX-like permease family protein [Gemmatimonadota bacterium]MYK54576.1 FtsX-like permease family protein [Gemmatimonadota bacterium]
MTGSSLLPLYLYPMKQTLYLAKNYLTIAIRNLLRHPGYSLINLSGLALGMACAVLLAIYISYELSYDRFRPEVARTYRVMKQTRHANGRIAWNTGQQGPLATVLPEEFPDVEDATRFWAGLRWINAGEKSFQQMFWLSDPNVFAFFGIEILTGDPQTVLQDPFSVVITESIARKFFGTINPIGKTITVDHNLFGGTYQITGLIRQAPHNSRFQYDFITATMPQGVRQRRSWDHWLPPAYSRPANTYLRLKPGANPEDIARKLPELVERYAEIAEDESETVRYYLHPVSRMHLYSKIDMPGFTGDAGRPYKDIQQIYLLGLVGFFILTIACINFMNLSTARSVSRAKEVGLRKVVGAYRPHLIKQFLGESLLLSALSACIALGLVYLALPPFSAFVQENLTLNSGLTLWILGITLFVGLLSGSYPALYLSAFEPATVLKGGAIKAGSAQAHVRKGLVVLQFAISIILIIGTIIVADQMRLIQEKDLGFNKEEVVVASIFRQDRYQSTGGQLQKRYLQIKDAFSQHLNITTVSATSDLPGNSWPNREWFFPEGDPDRGVEVRVFGADEAFIDCYDIPLLSGRNYDRTYAERAWERRGKPGELFVINETAAKVFGWTDPIGKTLNSHVRKGHVIGVVKDFHYRPLYETIEPLVITAAWYRLSHLSMRVRPQELSETMAFLQRTWTEFLPTRSPEIAFASDQLERWYRDDQRTGQIFSAAFVIAIFVACLGLLGLAAFTAEQRTKEIGIRKTMGASVWNLVILLCREFVILVGIANLIAYPIIYLAMDRWLQHFAYRIELGATPFVLGSLLTLGIALLTVSTQAWKAARTNPTETLRYE